MKNILLLLSLSLVYTSCTTPQIKEIKEDQSYPICFIKWEHPDHKEKYIKGLGMTRDEKSEKHLLFQIWQNGGIIIQEKIGDTYIVAFDISEGSQRSYIEKVINDNFIVSPNLMKELMFTAWKIKESDLSKMLKGHEKVDCKNYLDSQFL